MAKVAESESGVAASLRNTAQQAGGSIGLAVLGTVAFTAAANSARASAGARTSASVRAGHAALNAVYHHALASGFARGFEVAAGIMLVALIITVATIRIRTTELAGVNPRRGSKALSSTRPRAGRVRGTQRPVFPREGTA